MATTSVTPSSPHAVTRLRNKVVVPLIVGALLELAGFEPSAAQTQYIARALGDLPGGFGAYAHATNNPGEVVGEAYDANGHLRAFRWRNGDMIDLGMLGDPDTGSPAVATDINAVGQVVGWSIFHAFRWQDGVMTDLDPDGNEAFALGINDSGQVVGYMLTIGGEFHAFLWHDGVMTDLGTLGGVESSAFDINASGQVVGYSQTA